MLSLLIIFLLLFILFIENCKIICISTKKKNIKIKAIKNKKQKI